MRFRLTPILIGLLCAACAFVPASTSAPDLTPTASATEAPTPSAQPTPLVTPAPTPSATAEPSPSPTPDPSVLDLRLTGCNGGVVLEWSPSRHPDFSFYLGFRSPERRIEPQYPPIAPAVDWGDLYATDPFVTSGFDATVIPSATTWYYRVMAYDAAGRVLSTSPVRSARLHPVAAMELEVETTDDGRTLLRWTPFDGRPGCFSSYRILYGTGGFANTLLTTVSARERTELETGALHPGASYTLRVQAVRTTTLGHFVVGETAIVTHLVPQPEP